MADGAGGLACKFKIGRQDKIPADLFIEIMKFIPVKPDIRSASLDSIGLAGVIVLSAA
jgi:hypothetical protein